MDKADLSRLARADALATLTGHRRRALWSTLAVDGETPLALRAGKEAGEVGLVAPTEGEEVVGDYATLGLSLRRHPLALLRDSLRARGLRTAEEVTAARHGQWIRTSGLITCRQRPATASGVLFMTLEDETGYVNLVIWNDLVEKNRRPLLGSRLLAVGGQVQKQGLVVHVLAKRFEDLSLLLGQLSIASHDFH